MKWTKTEFRTHSRTRFVDIMDLVSDELVKSAEKTGACHVYMTHTTAGLTINENADPDVARDILACLARLVPVTGDYHHAEGSPDLPFWMRSLCISPGKIEQVNAEAVHRKYRQGDETKNNRDAF